MALMASRLTAQQIRKQARLRAVEAAAKLEDSARERFEAELAQQRARAKANEEDLGSFYGAEAAISDAEEHLATTKRGSTLAMSGAAQAIVAREGSVSAAATLLGVTPSRIRSLAKAANAQRTSADESYAGEQQHEAPPVDNGTDEVVSEATPTGDDPQSTPADLSA